jgi:hypothetical protein
MYDDDDDDGSMLGLTAFQVLLLFLTPRQKLLVDMQNVCVVLQGKGIPKF